MHTRLLVFVLAAVCLVAPRAQARPYRAIITRTAETTRSDNLELGLRYQGFFALDFEESQPYQQISPSLRFGILDNLEVNLYLELLALGLPGEDEFELAFGDIPVGLQWSFLKTPKVALGVYGRVTLPTGPSDEDGIIPSLSDGTWDWEGTLIGEFRATKDLRFMLNGGYFHQGTRDRDPQPDFDVPDAVQVSLAGTYNLDKFTMLGLEVVSRIYFEDVITPVWRDNATQVEIIPVLRHEAFPGLVLEAVAGVAVTPELSEIYQFRVLLGGTYEFDLASGPKLPTKEEDLRRPKVPARRRR
ncbi:transporter [Pyxidicoccus sp. MSG2]|uniref:transporter n=1 Tax=Pyxidicoccus sp. MSG2 TaxID=2996790 RepID=UPI00226E4C6E|nr:transporter [Pyxidicoccus sp. MSG2]MCY1015726.1 transporter [Pyxidicoccus sp. MSG2]